MAVNEPNPSLIRMAVLVGGHKNQRQQDQFNLRSMTPKEDGI
jgi:hypothetical protein